jgi:hypothetical protein
MERLHLTYRLCQVNVKPDGFVKNPISALRFIPLSLRRTTSAPHSTGFARLELGLFTKPSVVMTFYDFIKPELSDFISRRRSPEGWAPRRTAAKDAQASSTPPGFLQWLLTGSDGRAGRERCRSGLSGPI